MSTQPKHAGGRPAGPPNTPVTFRVPDSTLSLVDQLAEQAERTRTGVMVALMDDALRRVARTGALPTTRRA